jgi:hypothetical protein
MSMPTSPRTLTVSGFTPFGSTPALTTSNAGPPSRRRSASAIWLRAELPVQTKMTRIGVDALKG